MTMDDRAGDEVPDGLGARNRFGVGRSFSLSKSTYSGTAIAAACAQFGRALAVRVSETEYNYLLTVHLIEETMSLDRAIAELIRELTVQQARLHTEQRFGITRDRLVKAAFEHGSDE